MKNNLNKLVFQVKKAAKQARFVSCSKSLNDSLNKQPQSSFEPMNRGNSIAIIKDYHKMQQNSGKETRGFNKRKERKPRDMTLDLYLNKLQSNIDPQLVQKTTAFIAKCSNTKLFDCRNKLQKMEYHLGFELEMERLEPHVVEAVERLLKEINEAINKRAKLTL